jgi:UDP-N-acetylmuramoyl-tripeptide--D-alanyl-D-alanine ligase
VERIPAEALDRAIAMNLEFLLNNQKAAGNFTYEYDFTRKRESEEDSSVRQAGALWGLCLLHRRTPSERTAQAIRKGLGFFERASVLRDGKRLIRYPGEDDCRTGTVALVALALIDFLRASTPPDASHRLQLEQYLELLMSLRTPEGLFHGSCRLEDGRGSGEPSPYSDGETLLALVRAAKYLGLAKYQGPALASAEAMYSEHVVAALKRHPDSDQTKGFYQWGSMSFYELATSGWPNVEAYPRRVIDLAYWMIDVHRTLERGRNTGYAYEGLAHAWELARLANDRAAMEKIESVIQRGLARLLSWQVGNPSQNAYLRFHSTQDPRAVGGVMNGAADPKLRIDVTQHQSHATMLVREFLYRGNGGAL